MWEYCHFICLISSFLGNLNFVSMFNTRLYDLLEIALLLNLNYRASVQALCVFPRKKEPGTSHCACPVFLLECAQF